jgi:putative ATPase
MQATHFVGMPEARLALTQATLHLALAPKSNSVLTAYMAAAKDALETEQQPVPLHLRNAPTSLMKQIGYGSGYQYAHDYAAGRADDMACLPEALQGRRYYEANPRDKLKRQQTGEPKPQQSDE